MKMRAMRSSNPAMTGRIFEKVGTASAGSDAMTINGTINKVGIMLLLVIASLVQFVEMFLKKSIPALYAGLGIFLPLITTNCAVMGACLININEEYTFIEALVASFSYAVGFGLALILFAGVRERILLARVPKPLQDTAIALVTAGILSLTFMAFKGMV